LRVKTPPEIKCKEYMYLL